MSNGWRTIKSLAHKIRLHGRGGKGMPQSFSREKLRHAPQKEGGWEILCDLPPVWPRLVRPTNLMSRMNGKKTHTHKHTQYDGNIFTVFSVYIYRLYLVYKLQIPALSSRQKLLIYYFFLFFPFVFWRCRFSRVFFIPSPVSFCHGEFWRCRFYRVFFVPSPVSLCHGEYVVTFFSSEWCFSTLWPRAGFFISACVRIQS